MTITVPTALTDHLPPLTALNMHEQKSLPVSALSRPTEYARPLRPHWVAELARSWDDLKVGEVMVSKRADDTHRLLTGNHRWAALVMLQRYAYRLPCLVYYGLTVEQEAMIYLAQDRNRLRHTAADDFKALLRQGDPVAAGIERVLGRLGLEVAPYGGAGWSKNRIRAVSGLLRSYETNGEYNLEQALGLIRDEWTQDINRVAHSRKSPYNEIAIVSLSTFLRLYGGDDAFKQSNLRQAMARDGLEGFERGYLRQQMTAASRPMSGQATLYGVLSLLDLYNYNRRQGGRLDEAVARQAGATRFGMPGAPRTFQDGHFKRPAAEARLFVQQLEQAR